MSVINVNARVSYVFVFLFILVITSMNSKYKMILMESKKLNGSGLLQKASANNITADKILYEYAIQMVIENLTRVFNIIELSD